MATGARGGTRRTLSYSQATYYMQGNAALASAHANVHAYNAPRATMSRPVRKEVTLRRQMPLILALCALTCVLGFAVLTQYARCTQVSKEVGTLRNELNRVQGENEVLHKDISTMESAGRIQSYATNQLKMVVPSQEEIVTVRLPNPRPPSDKLVETPPQCMGWLNTLLGFLD